RTRVPVLLPRTLLTILLVLSTPLAPPAAGSPAVRWRNIATPSRADQSMVWDSRRDRALMFGGDLPDGQVGGGGWLLARDPRPHWVPFPTLGTGPLPRSGMSAVYDSLRDRVLVFGGRREWLDFSWSSDMSNELWALSLSGTPTWSLLDTGAGPMPAQRFDASLVLDAHDRIILFGGDRVSNPYRVR